MAAPENSWSQRQNELLELLRTGENIAAIARYREWTGLGLKESKEAIDHLERTGSLPPPPPKRSLELPPAIETQIVELLRARQKIQAIKIYRELSGCGLKDAKEAVEEIGRRHGIASSGGCAGVLLAGLLLAMLAWTSACIL